MTDGLRHEDPFEEMARHITGMSLLANVRGKVIPGLNGFWCAVRLLGEPVGQCFIVGRGLYCLAKHLKGHPEMAKKIPIHSQTAAKR